LAKRGSEKKSPPSRLPRPNRAGTWEKRPSPGAQVSAGKGNQKVGKRKKRSPFVDIAQKKKDRSGCAGAQAKGKKKKKRKRTERTVFSPKTKEQGGRGKAMVRGDRETKERKSEKRGEEKRKREGSRRSCRNRGERTWQAIRVAKFAVWGGGEGEKEDIRKKERGVFEIEQARQGKRREPGAGNRDQRAGGKKRGAFLPSVFQGKEKRPGPASTPSAVLPRVAKKDREKKKKRGRPAPSTWEGKKRGKKTPSPGF